MPCVLNTVLMIRSSTWKEEFSLLRVSKTFLTYKVNIQYMLWFYINFFVVLAVLSTHYLRVSLLFKRLDPDTVPGLQVAHAATINLCHAETTPVGAGPNY
jgi:hypothetical protein